MVAFRRRTNRCLCRGCSALVAGRLVAALVAEGVLLHGISGRGAESRLGSLADRAGYVATSFHHLPGGMGAHCRGSLLLYPLPETPAGRASGCSVSGVRMFHAPSGCAGERRRAALLVALPAGASGLRRDHPVLGTVASPRARARSANRRSRCGLVVEQPPAVPLAPLEFSSDPGLHPRLSQ